MVKFLTHGLRGFNGAVQSRLATLTVTMLISSCWQLSSEVELRRIFDVCKRWPNSGLHEFLKKNMVRYMRPHGRFAHCSCKNAVRRPPVLASCIEIYYCIIKINMQAMCKFQFACCFYLKCHKIWTANILKKIKTTKRWYFGLVVIVLASNAKAPVGRGFEFRCRSFAWKLFGLRRSSAYMAYNMRGCPASKRD